jgi:DNA-binding transcriptional regulator YhcF (GntR family)
VSGVDEAARPEPSGSGALDTSAIRIEPDSSVPPFEQVRVHIAGLVASGVLPAGTRLPTVRALAADLGLAANTAARVYRELEADGVLATYGRRGTFVRSAVTDGPAAAAIEKAAANFTAQARRSGLTRAEALRLVEQAWSAPADR